MCSLTSWAFSVSSLLKLGEIAKLLGLSYKQVHKRLIKHSKQSATLNLLGHTIPLRKDGVSWYAHTADLSWTDRPMLIPLVPTPRKGGRRPTTKRT